MYNPRSVRRLIDQAASGNLPASGDLEQADELIGFSFGLHFDAKGQLGDVGPVNEQMAHFILSNEVLRSKNMTLQEELAVAIKEQEPKFAGQIDILPTIKQAGKAFNTHELIMNARPKLLERNIGSLAVIAFRHHLPRAAAQVRKAGFHIATPDMSKIGDFDPSSSQPWIRDIDSWKKRESKVISAFALLNRI